MKYLILIALLITSYTHIFAQTDSIAALQTDSIITINPSTESSLATDSIGSITPNSDICIIDSIISKTSDLIETLVEIKTSELIANRYKLYPTKNLYNSLVLDTRTGKIKQVQWSFKYEKEFSTELNDQDLSFYNNLNSFELYPTENIYQFILLDKATGRTWHVQWETSSEKRWIRRIF